MRDEQSWKRFLTEVALYCVVGGVAGIPARWISVLNEQLFLDLFGVAPFQPFYRLPEDLVTCGIEGFSYGIFLGFIHGLICRYSWINRQALRTIIFWTLFGLIAPLPSLVVYFLEYSKMLPEWVKVLVGATLTSAAFGMLLAILGKLIKTILGSERESPLENEIAGQKRDRVDIG